MKTRPEPFDIPAAAAIIRNTGIRQWLLQEYAKSFWDARKGKLATFNEHKFELHWLENLPRLVDNTLDYSIKPGASTTFVVHDPKDREIFAAPFSDRNIHHFLYRICGGWWDHQFIDDSYSCRAEKGVYYGILRAWDMAKRSTNNFSEPAYIIQMDISNYFMSLPRQELYESIQHGLYRQFKKYLSIPEAYELYKICEFLWYQVITDDPLAHSKRRGSRKNWDSLAPGKSLRDQPPGRGIAIGNVTSQLASNIYLDDFDKFIHYRLGYKYYGRYVDDFFIMVKKPFIKQALKDVELIRQYLSDKKLLILHPKKFSVRPINQGFTFLGARIYPHCIIPSDRLQKKIKRTLHQVRSGSKVSNDRVISYFGLAKKLHTYKLMKRLFKDYDLDFGLYEEFLHGNRSAKDIITDLRTSHWHDYEIRQKSKSSPVEKQRNHSQCNKENLS